MRYHYRTKYPSLLGGLEVSHVNTVKRPNTPRWKTIGLERLALSPQVLPVNAKYHPAV